MFTGIVQGSFEVKNVVDRPGLKSFFVALPVELLQDLKIGASISINGTCHTAVKITQAGVHFDSMKETLDKTNIAELKNDDKVNIERSVKMGDEIGGHIMSGHVIGMGDVVRISTPENNYILTIKLNPEWMKYVSDKGFIGIDGCSLTIVNPNKEKNTFEVHLIPETLRETIFASKVVGDKVNIEIDGRTQTIVDTVEEYLKNK